MSTPQAFSPHPLLEKIEQYLRSNPAISAAAFGIAVMNDPCFVYQMRKGREPRRQTVAQVEAHLAKAKPPRKRAA